MNKTQVLILVIIATLLLAGFLLDAVPETEKSSPITASQERTDSIKHGEVKQYTSDGRLKTVVNYDQGVKHGRSYLFHEDGKTILLEMPYAHSKREGTSKKYYKDGSLYAETNYSNDQLDGSRTVYYSSGKVKSVVTYWKGLPGVGTREYLIDGTEKEQKSIEHYRKDKVIYLSVNPPCKRATFHIGSLEKDAFFDPINGRTKLLKEEYGAFFIDLNVYTPSYLQYQEVICRCESSQGNPIIIQKHITL